MVLQLRLSKIVATKIELQLGGWQEQGPDKHLITHSSYHLRFINTFGHADADSPPPNQQTIPARSRRFLHVTGCRVACACPSARVPAFAFDRCAPNAWLMSDLSLALPACISISRQRRSRRQRRMSCSSLKLATLLRTVTATSNPARVHALHTQ